VSMSGKEKPLPRPPKTPFGKSRSEEREEEAPLIADRMAAAMAEGKLEEFMKEEMPDNEYARALASMMMGMTGMMPSGGLPAPSGQTEQVRPEEEIPAPSQPPADVINAVEAGDVRGMMDLLAREHKQRNPGSGSALPEEKRTDDMPGLSDIEKETLNQLVTIASENKVSVDWIVLRALRLYIEEYRKTGRL
jgi:hypothetical protein